MKRILSLMLIAVLALSLLASCGGNGNGDETKAPAGDTTEPVTDAPVVLPYESAVDLANKIWAAIPEDNKFMCGGGDSENMAMNEAGKINVAGEEAAGLLVNIGLPADLVSKVDDAASLMNMMNANQLTMGVYHFTNAEDAKAAVAAIKAEVFAKEWMCGFPEKLVVLTLPGNYVISFYGLGGLDPDPNFAVDLITPFVTSAEALVEGVEVAVNEAIPY